MALGPEVRLDTFYGEENRLSRVVSDAQTTEYTYDGDGRLVKKVAPEGTTLYVSPYFEVTTAITPPEPLPTPTPNPALAQVDPALCAQQRRVRNLAFSASCGIMAGIRSMPRNGRLTADS